MRKMNVKATLMEEMLGMQPASADIHEQFIASKAPDAPSRDEEVAASGVDEVVEKGRTVFPRLGDGIPFLWDYQIKGMMKDVCSALRRVKGTRSSKVTAYKKVIDGTIFVEPRRIPIAVNGEVGNCSRPLRAQTAQGERVAIADSETVPEGSTFSFTVICMNDDDTALVGEWLDYLTYRGFGQWRNSGKGRAVCEVVLM